MGKIDRIGEERVNNFGSKMVIKEYRKYKDIDVYFQSIIGFLNMRDMIQLKKEILNVHMNLDYMDTVI